MSGGGGAGPDRAVAGTRRRPGAAVPRAAAEPWLQRAGHAVDITAGVDITARMGSPHAARATAALLALAQTLLALAQMGLG